ncbi:MAG TPA: rhodanese-like domain-containing protein [Xenococcaceae cyanobacterium]|jgi:rhodanese-related sulfurtransferase
MSQPIKEAKDKVTEALPTPPGPAPVSSAQALKERLQWGEPALTIIDARDRDAFLTEHITGAMLMSDVDFGGLSENRELYIYANSDEETAEMAQTLRQQGFNSVSQLKGGLAGWKAISGATEGRAT